MNLNTSHFAPSGIHKSLIPYESDKEQYEFIKAAFRKDLKSNEVCMAKCNLNFESDGALNAAE